MKLCTLIFLFAGIATCLFGQTGKLSGRVLDAKTLQPLPFTNVYINNTTIGTSANASGEFTLVNLPVGTTEIVFSFLGYIPQKQKIIVSEKTISTITIQLTPDAQQVSEVQVKAGRDKAWEKQLRRFERVFLGNTSSCKILNSWVLNFTEEANSITANASLPLEIENRLLGYKLFFQLKKFGSSSTGFFIVGDVRFTELETADASTALSWTKNREQAYRGSVKHLMKSILDKQIARQGFSVYRDKINGKLHNTNFTIDLQQNLIPYDTTAIVTASSSVNEYRISMKEKMEVIYTNDFTQTSFYTDLPNPVSWLDATNGYVLVNKEGTLLNPTQVIIAGTMADARVASMLPLDYKPGSRIVIQSPTSLLAKKLQEKVYLHTDKPYYYPGDNIWFSAYMTYRTPGLMDTLSKVLYVDLINVSRKTSKQLILKLDSGRSASAFKLPTTIAPGNYILRAYTQWMRNYGIDQFFYKPISILPLDQGVVSTSSKAISDAVLKISFDKDIYKKRDKVNMVFSLDSTEQTDIMKGTFSVSVVDETVASPFGESTSIKSNFELPDLSQNTPPQLNFPIETGITIQGVYQDKKGKGKKTTFTLLPENLGGIYPVTTGSVGQFSLTNLSIYDSTKFVVQPADGKIRLFGNDVPELPENLPAFSLPQTPLKTPHVVYSLDSLQAKILEAVTVSAKKIVKYESSYGQPDQIITGESIESYATIAEAIAAKLPSYKLIYDQTNWYLIWARASVPTSTDIRTGSSLASHEPTLYVNNVLVVGETTGDRLMQLNPSLIDHIELNGMITSNQGANGSSGLINVFTKRTSEVNSKPLSVLKVRGFDREVPFISVNYERLTPTTDIQDYRSTLYWNPRINLTSTLPSAALSFFTSDQTGTYRVVVEGITNKGNAIRSEARISVIN
ncbi:carboxypeptidase-like regulatory domain-containing protein [Spirosoma pollinicola]|uniref:TonB-dependent receptor n=1 Tax=Spirosoma pollinicola TaxID=2057025 RepID=A0A2K8YTE3_9BACT|nr:carboxypeptidase-like regulatory domain-containing protein [Spirosoma pollinicola]AUD00893.1 hypothetical protein CWM47_03120 [Spirosoma pollinicola]